MTPPCVGGGYSTEEEDITAQVGAGIILTGECNTSPLILFTLTR